MGSTTESTGAKVTSTGLAIVFLTFAAATAWIVWRTRTMALSRPMAMVLGAFAVWTVGVWSVRVAFMFFADHPVGFKVVHALLGLVSVALAVPAWRAGSRRWSPEAVAS
jgi:hypothetical protein